MKKQALVMLLAGSIGLSLAACGNQQAEQPKPAERGSAGTAAGQTAEPTYRSLFQTSVFLGDSITEGLSFHDVLDEANVAAGAGKTAEFALEDVEEIAKRKPERIFIQLGSDDILWPTDDPVSYSYKHYAKLIDSLKEKLPQAKLTILSVTPVTAEAEKQEPRYRNIAAYNKGLQELAAKHGVAFVDVSPLVAGNEDLYDTDGIHFKGKYYRLLLDYLKDRLN